MPETFKTIYKKQLKYIKICVVHGFKAAKEIYKAKLCFRHSFLLQSKSSIQGIYIAYDETYSKQIHIF